MRNEGLVQIKCTSITIRGKDGIKKQCITIGKICILSLPVSMTSKLSEWHSMRWSQMAEFLVLCSFILLARCLDVFPIWEVLGSPRMKTCTPLWPSELQEYCLSKRNEISICYWYIQASCTYKLYFAMKVSFVQDSFVISFWHIVEKRYFYNLTGFYSTFIFDGSGLKLRSH